MFAYLKKKTREIKRRFWLATDSIHKRQVPLNYQPVEGRKSAKAERLVEYCLGYSSHQLELFEQRQLLSWLAKLAFS